MRKQPNQTEKVTHSASWISSMGRYSQYNYLFSDYWTKGVWMVYVHS